ncbi:MAG: TIGR03435 family protein [Acidobacteriota bacterium]
MGSTNGKNLSRLEQSFMDSAPSELRPEKRIRRILDSIGASIGISRWGIAAIVVLGAPLTYLAAAGRSPSTAPPVAAPAHNVLAPAPQVAAPMATPVLMAQQLATPPPSSAHIVPTANARPTFEVASIKPVVPGGVHVQGAQVNPGARVLIRTETLKGLIIVAFGVSYRDISGGDDWTEKDEYDVEAQPSEAMQAVITDLRYTNFSIEDVHLQQMLQALLIDRFQLKFHREIKTAEVYFLKRNGKPSPLKAKETPIDPSIHRGGAFGSIGYAGGQWGIFDTSMPQLAKFAGDHVMGVPILDQTGLTGRFDYRQRSPDIDPQYSGDQSPSFRIYLDELGLKLERGKEPVETFVIDHASKPSPN